MLRGGGRNALVNALYKYGNLIPILVMALRYVSIIRAICEIHTGRIIWVIYDTGTGTMAVGDIWVCMGP